MSPRATTAAPLAHREHPWERARRLAFARWESEVRHAPFGRVVSDVVGFAQSIVPPPHRSDSAESRRLFAFSALPSGAGPTYLAVVPAGRRRPADGALVRLVQPEKRVLAASDAAYGEMVIEASAGVVSATWDDIVEGISAPAPGAVTARLAELWGLSPAAAENLLLPVVGSIPWHGRPAGLDLLVEVDGWSLARHRAFLTNLLPLVPQWVAGAGRSRSSLAQELELVSGARIRRRPAMSDRPFSLLLRPISAPPTAAPPSAAPPRSIISYGRALVPEFVAALSSGSLFLLLDAEKDKLPAQRLVEIPDPVRAGVWGLHWWTPDPPDAPDWYRWLRSQESRLREGLDRPAMPPDRPGSPWSSFVDRREFRDRLAQITYSRARLRGGRAVEESDLVATIDALLRSLERVSDWAHEGHGPLTRSVDRSERGRTTRVRQALEGLFGDREDGLTVAEARAELRSIGVTASVWEVENHLERLRIGGLVYQDRSGRYRPV
jgi:hypothetical protein